MTNASRKNQGLKQGTVIVEFLLVFPAFLVLSLFTLEIGLMWADKHIVRLAAFEAARSLASAPMPEQQSDGTFSSNPCTASHAMGAARQAAIRKVAIISPSIFYFNAGLGSYQLPGLDAFATTINSLPSPTRRLLTRWSTAAAFTKLNCHYDESMQMITTGITYYRSPQTPVVGRLIWLAHMLNQGGVANLLQTISVKPDFFGIEGRLDAAAASELKNAIGNSFQLIRDTEMEGSQAAEFLAKIPGSSEIFGPLVSPVAIGSAIDTTLSSVTNQTKSQILAVQSTSEQSMILTNAIYATPESLRFIPLHVKSSVARHIFGPDAVEHGGTFHDPNWEAVVHGVAKLNDGVFNEWSRNMSKDPQFIKDGNDL